MRILRWLMPVLAASLSGCVLGYGRCLWLEPASTSLTGKIDYREFRDAKRLDRAPILILDRTEYIYAPAQSKQCQSAHEVQLVPLGDLPYDVIDKSHVSVQGSLVQASRSDQHTRFVFNVATVHLIK